MRRPFSKIESSLEFMVERPFTVLFRRSVQPAEVGKRLKKTLIAGKFVSVRGQVAPNDFVVYLEPNDAVPYLEHGPFLARDLAEWLEETAESAHLALLDSVRVRFEADPSIRRGTFDIQASVCETSVEPVRFEDPGLTEAFDTVGRMETGARGFIEICSGPSTGSVFPVRKQSISIGRDLGNDLVIDSPEVSRFHAEFQVIGDQPSISDRNSMNGTFVNGIQVHDSQIVQSGDQLIFGTTICRYWAELI